MPPPVEHDDRQKREHSPTRQGETKPNGISNRNYQTGNIPARRPSTQLKHHRSAAHVPRFQTFRIERARHMTTQIAPITSNELHATANRAEICDLFGFRRTTWQTLTATEGFPRPNGYVNRWPTYSVSGVASWLVEHAPRRLLKTEFGQQCADKFAHDAKAVAAGGDAVFAALLGMGEAEFEMFLEDWPDLYEEQRYGESGAYWPLDLMYVTAIEHHRQTLRYMRGIVQGDDAEDWRVAASIEAIPRLVARIEQIAAEATAKNIDVTEAMKDFD